jgi:hypothetical protein
VIWALVASEYAHGLTMLTVMGLCGVLSALVGRWWTLAVPFALAAGVVAAASIDWYYQRAPEDLQAGAFFGAAHGLVLAATALLVRRYVGPLGGEQVNAWTRAAPPRRSRRLAPAGATTGASGSSAARRG